MTQAADDGAMLPGMVQLLAVLLAIYAGTLAVSAQTITSELRGTVTDATGGVLDGAIVEVDGPTGRRDTVSDDQGFLRVSHLTPGSYTVTVRREGFQPAVLGDVTLVLNRTTTLDVELAVGQTEQVTVRGDAPAADRSRSSLSSIISPQTMDVTPVNGRNYLDLIRLTPGVVENARAGSTAPMALDTTGAILGERAGNISFLIDGLWNNDTFTGGVLQNLTQDTVEQFEVIATGYAAEFGQGAGGVVNVITRSGTNQLSGSGFSYIRNDAFDGSNVEGEDPPELALYNVGLTLGGPIVENRDWFFGSFEYVSEDRAALFPQDIPAALAAQEDFTRQPKRRDQRLFGKYTRRVGAPHLLNVLGSWETLDQRNQLTSGSALPSAGQDTDETNFLTSAKLASQLSSRALFEAQFGVRGQSFDGRGSTDESRSFSAFFLDTGRSFQFGPPIGSVRMLDQRHYTARGSLTWFVGSAHTLKGGAEYTRTTVDGVNEPGLTHVLVTTTASYDRYGNDGFQLPQGVGFLSAEDQLTRIRNNGGAFFLQDDWQLASNITVNAGVRYEIDSVFNDGDNVAPRLGVAWAADERTVVRANWGLFYDRYRLGIADAVPGFGGFDGRTVVEAGYPRLVADAIPLGPGALGILGLVTGDPFILHRTFGIPTDAVVSSDNVSELTGLSPDAFVAEVNGVLVGTGIPFIPVGFSPHTGFLTQDLGAEVEDEIRVADTLRTPFNRSWSVGVEREVWNTWTAGATYVHRSIQNIMGLRITNLSPIARDIGFPLTTDGGPIQRTYGPWYEGEYDAMILSLDTGSSSWYRAAMHYTWADATDNLLNSNLALGIATQGAGSVPTDNLDIEFDRGPSDFSVRHSFVAFGHAELPWEVTVSAVAQATSGVYFSAAGLPIDYDGDGISSSRPRGTARNEFRGPKTFNLNLRVEKRFHLGLSQRLGVLVEFFNLTNSANPRLINNGFVGGAQGPDFGTTRVPLPGREMQVGIRYSF